METVRNILAREVSNATARRICFVSLDDGEDKHGAPLDVGYHAASGKAESNLAKAINYRIAKVGKVDSDTSTMLAILEKWSHE